ncbi:MAG: hypothetical protein JO192_09105 [Candidatus Eremiobacteraeota bacterium]|nr:hypothetical protein [Candidatus Eremiobacteraeota bacterium]
MNRLCTAVVALTACFATAAVLALTRLDAHAAGLTKCAVFTGHQWTSVADAKWTGSKYQAVVMGAAPMSCDDATALAKKFVATKIGGNGLQPMVISGGPAGWTCKAVSDTTGYAYQGHCYKGGDAAAGATSWGPPLGSF